MTTVDILSRAGVDEAQEEQARRAVKAFRLLQPTLTAYARALTGKKDVLVVMASNDNGSTDGKNIYFRPPIALGDNTSHLADALHHTLRMEESYLLVCEACRIREEVMVTILHEIGHIAFDTFGDIPDEDKARAIEFAIKEQSGNSEYARRITERIKALPPREVKWYGQLASHINAYLPFLVNCLEDARVNAAMFEARPGMRRMFYADTKQVFKNGYEVRKPGSATVEIASWKEAPLNSQAAIGVFCLASGYDVTGWFHPDIDAALRDPQLVELSTSMDKTTTAAQVFNLSFKVLARLRELGFCGTPQDPDPQPEPEPEESPDETDNQVDQDVEPQEGDQSPEDSGETDSGEPGTADDENPSGEDGDPGEDRPATGDTSGESETPGDGKDQDEPAEGEVDDGPGESDEQTTDSESGEAGEPSPEGSASAEDGQSDPDHGAPDSTDSDESRGDDASGDGEPDEEGSPSGEGERTSGSGGGASTDRVDELTDDSDSSDDTAGEESTEPSDGGESDGVAAEPSDSGEDGDEATPGDSAGSPGTDERDDARPADGPESESDTDSSGEPDVGDEPSTSPAGVDGDPDLDEDDSAVAESGGEEGGEGEGEGASDTSPAPLRGSDGSGEPEDSDTADDHSEPEVPVVEDDGEAIDSGADDGYGGTEVENEPEPRPEMGEPEDVDLLLLKWGNHEEKPKTLDLEGEENAMDRAIIQGIYFTKPSSNIWGVREFEYSDDVKDPFNLAWGRRRSKKTGGIADLAVPEVILQPAVMHTRRAFTDNRRGAQSTNLRKGRVNGRVLHRAGYDKDPRIMQKRSLPGVKDYEVVIGMDLSGSTIGKNIALEKRAVYAQAELLHRAGIPFSIVGHTGWMHDGETGNQGLDLQIYWIKRVNEPWNDEPKTRLDAIGSAAANLDGHALEFLRKLIEKSSATEKIIMYYSDGKMPAENKVEELEILTREIQYCKGRGIILQGVGIRTDSPAQHGLDTVQIDEDEDLIKVVQHLGKRISAHI